MTTVPPRVLQSTSEYFRVLQSTSEYFRVLQSTSEKCVTFDMSGCVGILVSIGG
jgi:hypothetical protein